MIKSLITLLHENFARQGQTYYNTSFDFGTWGDAVWYKRPDGTEDLFELFFLGCSLYGTSQVDCYVLAEGYDEITEELMDAIKIGIIKYFNRLFSKPKHDFLFNIESDFCDITDAVSIALLDPEMKISEALQNRTTAPGLPFAKNTVDTCTIRFDLDDFNDFSIDLMPIERNFTENDIKDDDLCYQSLKYRTIGTNWGSFEEILEYKGLDCGKHR